MEVHKQRKRCKTMTISTFLDKYAHYNVSYDVKDKIIFVRKKIPTNKFLEFKKDLNSINVKVEDLRVIS